MWFDHIEELLQKSLMLNQLRTFKFLGILVNFINGIGIKCGNKIKKYPNISVASTALKQ